MMEIRSVVVLAVFALALHAGLVSSLAVTRSYWAFKEMPIGFNMELKSSVFFFEFDTDIYMKDPRDNQTKAIGLIHDTSAKSVGDSTPPIIMASRYMIYLYCNNTFNLSTISGFNGPPMELIVTHGTEEPMSSFLGIVGGYQFPSPRPNNTLAFMLLDTIPNEGSSTVLGKISLSALGQCNNGAGPKIVFNTSTTVMFSTSGTPINLNNFTQPQPFGPSPRPEQCSYAGVLKLQSNWVDFLNAAESSVNFNSLSFGLGAVTGMEAYKGCGDLLDTLLVSYNKTYQVFTDSCTYARDTVEYMTDPCCNYTLTFTMCCTKRAVDKTFKALQDLNLPAIQAACVNPSKIEAVIRDYIDYKNFDLDTSQFDGDKLVRAYTDILQECQTKQYSQCKSDTDCLAGATCDKRGNRCQYDWQDDYVLLRCVYDFASIEILQEFALEYNITIDPLSSNLVPTLEDFLFKIRELSSDFNCVGYNAYEFGTKWVESRDENGNQIYVKQPANETGCLAEKTCNWNSNIMTQEECENQTTTDFCGECGYNGSESTCWERSQFSRCELGYPASQDSTSCSTFGQGNPYIVWDTQFNRCLDKDPAHTVSAEACSGSYDVCNYTSCQYSSFCYNDDVANCYNGTYTSPNINGPYCVFYLDPSAPTLCSGLGTVHMNKYYQLGQFDTKASCDLGYCPTTGQPATAAECAAVKRCTIDCWSCRSTTNYYQQNGGSCIMSNVTNSTDCSSTFFMNAESGKWDEKSQFCYFQYAANATTCVGDNLVWVACEGDLYTCGSTVPAQYQNFTSCSYQRGYCNTEADCLNASKCSDDWEFLSYSYINNNYRQVVGACIVQVDTSSRGYADCYSLGQNYQSISLPGKCKITDVLDAATCAAFNGTWTLPAFSKEQCSAQGQACWTSQGYNGFNLRNSSECTECFGSFYDVYSFYSGQWLADDLRPLYWRPRQWVAKNKFIRVSQSDTIWKLFRDLGSKIVGREFLRLMREKYGNYIALLNDIGCDCGGSQGCFQNIRGNKIAEQPAVPLQDLRMTTSAGDLFVAGEDIDELGLVEAGKVFPSAFAGDGNSTKRQAGSTVNYDVVKNDNGATVGRIASNGVNVTFSGPTKVKVSVPVREDMRSSAPTTYSTPAFAFYNKTSNALQVLRVPTNVSNNVGSTSYSMNLVSSGLFFAVLVDPNYANMTVPPVTSPSKSTAPSPIATSPIAPSPSSTSTIGDVPSPIDVIANSPSPTSTITSNSVPTSATSGTNNVPSPTNSNSPSPTKANVLAPTFISSASIIGVSVIAVAMAMIMMVVM